MPDLEIPGFTLCLQFAAETSPRGSFLFGWVEGEPVLVFWGEGSQVPGTDLSLGAGVRVGKERPRSIPSASATWVAWPFLPSSGPSLQM